MGAPALFLGLICLVSSSLANPITLDRAISSDEAAEQEDLGLLEGRADKLRCDNNDADRCLLFPIGCVSGVDCTDRLEIRRITSGTNIHNLLISLNLHVSRSQHMLVAVPMPDISNPNSTLLVGCSIDEASAVVAHPDVDGVTEQLKVHWLDLVSVRATADDLECVVSAAPGFIDLPQGDVAVFAGELQPEEEVQQQQESHRIRGSLAESERAPEEAEPARVQVQPSSIANSEEEGAILRSVEDQRPATSTQIPRSSPALSSRERKLRLKALHDVERPLQRHSSNEQTQTTHAGAHHHPASRLPTTTVAAATHEPLTTTTTTQKPSSTTVPAEEESEEEAPTVSASTTEPSATVPASTTVPSAHHESHHHHVHSTHRHESEEKRHSSHERAQIDTEHHSVRMAVTSTTTEAPALRQVEFQNDEEEEEEMDDKAKELQRRLMAGDSGVEGAVERREDEERPSHRSSEHSTTSSSHHNHRNGEHVETYELSREAAQDPIGKRPDLHEKHHSHSHHHSTTTPAAEEDAEEEDTTPRREIEHREGLRKNDDRASSSSERRMGEKRPQTRNEEEEEADEDEDEDEDDASSALSLIIPIMVCLAPVIFG